MKHSFFPEFVVWTCSFITIVGTLIGGVTYAAAATNELSSSVLFISCSI